MARVLTRGGIRQVSGAAPARDAGGVKITCKDRSQQMRCFNYSTLSRLMWASNPESGTVVNTYDNNGNLLTQTDANGTVTTLAGYDLVNRPASVTYTPGNTGITGFAVLGTPTVTYAYDTCANGAFKGALCSVSTPASSTSYSYDGLGRIAGSSQTTPAGGSNTYTFTYGYSLTDQLTSMTYPSGRQVNYALDAADRVTTVQNVTGGGNYASNISYTADGGLTGMTLGQGLTQTMTWNDRLQPLTMTAKSASG